MTGPQEERNEPSSAGTSRALADILAEAGISKTGAGGRRRRRDDSETEQESGPPAYPGDTAEHAVVHDFGSPEPADSFGTEPGSLASYLLADRDPGSTENGAAGMLPPRTDTGPILAPGWAAIGWPEIPVPQVSAPKLPSRIAKPAVIANSQGTASAAPPATRGGATAPPATRGGTTAPVQTVAAARAAAAAKAQGSPLAEPVSAAAEPASDVEPSTPAAPAHANRSPSPLATTPPADTEDDHPTAIRAGAASWAILGVELLAALGLGVAAWYAFSALWELLPFVAAFAGPLVVTGLVAVAGALRSRTGRNPLGLPTLCILVFAGTILVVLPAATVIIP